MSKNIELKDVIDSVLQIFERKSLSILIITLVILFPLIASEWINLFSSIKSLIISLIVVIVLIPAIFFQWKEIKARRRKVRLVNCLKKRGRSSIHYLTTEWDAKDDYSEKTIKDLIARFPEELFDVKVKGGDEYRPGVDLVTEDTTPSSVPQDK